MLRLPKLLPVAGVALVALATATGGSSAGAATPHITAHPTHVMVNSRVSLEGTGFAPATTITLEECSAKEWIAPLSPCLTSNQIRVHTNAKGVFKATMAAEICPAVAPGTVTQRKCYVGQPIPSGVDTINLVGAAKIVVSWP